MFPVCLQGISVGSSVSSYIPVSGLSMLNFLGVNECANVFVHGTARWTGVPFKVCLCDLNVPGIDRLWMHRDPDQDKAVTEDESMNLQSQGL